MLGRQFGIMLTYINISHLSGFHRTTRLHARWRSCGHRTLGMSQMGLGRVKRFAAETRDEAGLRCELLFPALTMLGSRPSVAGCP